MAGIVLMLVLVGGSLSTFDVAARTLLQRAAPTDLLARVFGLVEGLEAATIAAGALLAGALVAVGGATLCAVVPRDHSPAGRVCSPAGACSRSTAMRTSPWWRSGCFAPCRCSPRCHPRPWRRWHARYSGSRFRRERSSSGRETPATSSTPSQTGEVEVVRDGNRVAVLGRGDGFGELALLLDRPRNATVRTLVDSRLYTLSPDEFVPAVTGHPRAAQAGADLVRVRLEPEASLPDSARP